jgi:hypothetical protein
MRKKTFLFLLLIYVSVFSNVMAQRDDKRKTSENAMEQPKVSEGIVYALPRNGIRVTVVVSIEKSVPGPYAEFANKYLGIVNPVTSVAEKHQITNIDMELFSEPDPNAIYKTADTLVINIAQLPNGVISGVNLPLNQPQIKSNIIGNTYLPLVSIQTAFIDLSSNDFYDFEVNPQSGSESLVQKSKEDIAREAADYIIKLRKKRAYTILNASDVVPEDGLGYQVFLEEARRLDEAYTALFAGKRNYFEQTYTFTFVPGDENVKNEILFRFSEEKGILPKTDMSGRPVYLAISKENDSFSSISKQKQSGHPLTGARGLYYRMPVTASIVLTDGLNTLYYGRTEIAQMGVLIPVPVNMTEGKHKLQYNTSTGNISGSELNNK